MRILENIIFKLNAYKSSNIIKRYFLRKKNTIRAIYLEGKYGVGKTHLLAAAYSSYNGSKAFISFSELTSLINYFTLQKIKTHFKNIDLICIDEFELDDPANTMLISNFISYLIENDSFIVTTSNTIPEELGQGRFNIKDFKNEIGKINQFFRVLQIDGDDYRKKDHDNDYILRSNISTYDYQQISFEDLNQNLKKMPLLEIIDFAKSKKHWFISDLEAYFKQDEALRFSFFIDKIYDYNIHLMIKFKAGTVLFDDEILNGSYEKKYKRCISRIYELTQNLS